MSQMTYMYIVSGGASNPIYSLTQSANENNYM